MKERMFLSELKAKTLDHHHDEQGKWSCNHQPERVENIFFSCGVNYLEKYILAS